MGWTRNDRWGDELVDKINRIPRSNAESLRVEHSDCERSVIHDREERYTYSSTDWRTDQWRARKKTNNAHYNNQAFEGKPSAFKAVGSERSVATSSVSSLTVSRRFPFSLAFCVPLKFRGWQKRPPLQTYAVWLYADPLSHDCANNGLRTPKSGTLSNPQLLQSTFSRRSFFSGGKNVNEDTFSGYGNKSPH